MRFLRILALFSLLLQARCGIETSVPSGDTNSVIAERAVVISEVYETGTGNIVTCELNSVLVSPGLEIPLFLEYQGEEVQRTTLENETSFTFDEYNPPETGNVVCVVEFASAEFESESMTLQSF